MANAILGLWAETSLHAGASASSGVIDLPIQRESHTGWPCVFGSGVKGALRTKADGQSWEYEVFGPPHAANAGGGSDHAGALAVTDARLLLLPVRSLTTHFKWVTSPALLRRAIADHQRLQFPLPESLKTLVAGLSPTLEQAIVASSSGSQNLAKPLFLEEFSFTEVPLDLESLIDFMASFMGGAKMETFLKAQLVIIHDDTFAHLSQFATPVNAHIAIDNARKRVKDGALWYEETLPPDTVLYVGLQAFRSRQSGRETTAAAILEQVRSGLFEASPYLQMGGNETVGMGWCKVTWLANSLMGHSSIENEATAT